MDDDDLRPLFSGRLRPGHLIAIDMVTAVVLALVTLGTTWLVTDGRTVPGWVAVATAVLVATPVAIRRWWPIPALCLSLAVAVACSTANITVFGYLGLALVLYRIANVEPRRRSLIALGVAVAVGICGNLAHIEPYTLGLVFFACVTTTVGWVLGRTARERRLYATRSAEQLLAGERMRIARELHDVVAHSMSLIAVKAGIANHVADERPEEARDALRVIEATSRDALAEMRRLLGVLRSDTDSPDLAPAPGLVGLPALAEQAAMAGVRVDLDVRGPGALPEGVELSVYRIVQEALTNVVKHAAPARCKVTVESEESEVRVEVTDDGPGTRVLPGKPGHGLVGMRERVMTYGGDFFAGPGTAGGFRVSARMSWGTA